ncbi:MAG: nitroreductase family protein [Verrucomicrobiota bacterium JB025]|nr:nitroreductase family protein [Verrucomicrobiota bacterium JB025]
MNQIPFSLPEYGPEEARARAEEFHRHLATRRTVRSFRSDPIPDGVIEAALLAAGTAPNGANLQPWHFAVIRNPAIKRRIREAAEQEERAFYQDRATDSWLEDLAPLGTDASKPFLETAPALIAIFLKNRTTRPDGRDGITYYPKESVGIATGMLITALHHAGIATLTHTPSPMGFLNEILDRPSTERPFLLLVAGYPSIDCQVPEIRKLPLDRIATFH